MLSLISALATSARWISVTVNHFHCSNVQPIMLYLSTEKLQCFAGNPGQLGRLESLLAQRVTVSCWPPKPGGVSWPVLPQEDNGPPLGSSSSLSPCHTQQPLHISPRMVAIIRALMERCRFSFSTPGGVALGLACAGFKSSGTYAPHRCPAQSKR
ncbi:hypothetical protein EMCRGX_G005800 [Ephydatia muelleri]